MVGRDAQILKILFAVRLEIVIQLAVRAFFAEGLEFHLLKFNGAEGKVTGRNLIAERLADLPDGKRQFRTHSTLDIQKVDIFALRVFGAQINHAFAVVGNAAEGLEHQIKFTDIREIVLAAVRAGNVMILNVLEHFLFGHPVGVRVGVEIVN